MLPGVLGNLKPWACFGSALLQLIVFCHSMGLLHLPQSMPLHHILPKVMTLMIIMPV